MRGKKRAEAFVEAQRAKEKAEADRKKQNLLSEVGKTFGVDIAPAGPMELAVAKEKKPGFKLADIPSSLASIGLDSYMYSILNEQVKWQYEQINKQQELMYSAYYTYYPPQPQSVIYQDPVTDHKYSNPYLLPPSYVNPSHFVGGHTILDDLAKLVPDINVVVACPACGSPRTEQKPCGCSGCSGTILVQVGGREGPVQSIVQHLNDAAHRWSREQIADWLDTLDLDLQFRTPNPEGVSA